MIIIIIILCITALEIYALYLGYDGKILLTVVGVLSTIAGWQGKKSQLKREQRKLDAMLIGRGGCRTR
jgi:hypothetical protein